MELGDDCGGYDVCSEKAADDKPLDEVKFNKPLAAILALIVGVGSGIVGAAGGFLLVPIMLVCP